MTTLNTCQFGMDAMNRLKYLLSRLNDGTALPGELTELEGLLNEPVINIQQEEIWKNIPEEARFFDEEKSKSMFAAIVRRNSTTATINFKQRRNRWAMLAAASLAIIASGAVFFKSIQPIKNVSPVAALLKQEVIVLPGSDNAILVLDDGSTVTLDQAANGPVGRQGSTQILKKDGQLLYSADETAAPMANVVYNTLKTPRGGQYQLILADGTKVWMNAGSSLHFPTTFPGKERVVMLTGEAYFEVAKDAHRKFSVQVNGTTVNVLGTHFNVMAYENEASMAITLLEGSINVAGNKSNVTLRPGQQAQLKLGEDFMVLNNVNLEETLSWKNGYFQFNHTKLDVLMRQIERWYKVDAVYKGKIPDRQFGGKISRKSDIQHVIKILAASKVYVKLEGDKLIILDR